MKFYVKNHHPDPLETHLQTSLEPFHYLLIADAFEENVERINNEDPNLNEAKFRAEQNAILHEHLDQQLAGIGIELRPVQVTHHRVHLRHRL